MSKTEHRATKVCGACGISQEKNKFSKNQWRKRQGGRCLGCVDADTPLLRPEEKKVMALPGRNLYCSPELLEEDSGIKFIRDENGNAAVDLTDFLADERDLCGNQQCPKKAKKFCTRCNRVSYCSKECQVADWKRHRKAECVRKTKTKRTDEVLDMDQAAVSAATAKATDVYMDAVLELCEDKRSGKEDTWKEDLQRKLPPSRNHGDAGNFDLNPLRDFYHKYYLELASFAAVHIDKYPRLKGALFLFTKVSIYDLTNVDLGGREASVLDRQFLLVWGCRYVTGETHHPMFSIRNLACEDVLNQCTSLPHLMEHACDKDSFPVVICSDPSGYTIPDRLEGWVRPPNGVDPVDYIHDSPRFVSCNAMRFFKFDVMLEMGNSMPETEVYGVNMDRKEDDPVR